MTEERQRPTENDDPAIVVLEERVSVLAEEKRMLVSQSTELQAKIQIVDLRIAGILRGIEAVRGTSVPATQRTDIVSKPVTLPTPIQPKAQTTLPGVMNTPISKISTADYGTILNEWCDITYTGKYVTAADAAARLNYTVECMRELIRSVALNKTILPAGFRLGKNKSHNHGIIREKPAGVTYMGEAIMILCGEYCKKMGATTEASCMRLSTVNRTVLKQNPAFGNVIDSKGPGGAVGGYASRMLSGRVKNPIPHVRVLRRYVGNEHQIMVWYQP